MSKSRVLGPSLALISILLSISFTAKAQTTEGEPWDAVPGHPVIRVDLNAGAFLDPVPFDQPFIVSGYIPAATRSVLVRIQEYVSLAPVRWTPERLRTFEGLVRSFLDSTVSGASPAPDVREGAWVRGRLGGLLLEAVGKPTWRRPSFSAVLPWNWSRWLTSGGSTAQVVAPGSMYDVDGLPDADAAAFRDRLAAIAGADSPLARGLAVDDLIRAAVDAAEGARIGVLAGPGVTTAGWNRLKGALGATDDDARGDVADLSIRWNRLETDRLRRRGERWELRSFQAAVSALNPNRHYVFGFTFERDMSRVEAVELRASVQRWLADRAAAGTLEAEDAAAELGRAIIRSAGSLTGVAHMRAADGGPDLLGASYRETLASTLAAVALNTGDKLAMATAAESLVAALGPVQLEGRSSVVTDTEAGNYVSADVGMLHAREIRETGIYAGVNIYLGPVNKRVPLARRGGLDKRLAFVAGLALQSIRDERRTRDNLFWRQSVVLGAGLRITRHVRVGAGALILRERDPDTFPLTDKKRLAVTPYLSLSLDADVGGWLGSTVAKSDWRAAR